MKVVESLSEIAAELLNSIFWKLLVLLDQLKQVTSGTVFKNNPQMVSRFVPVKKLQDVSIFQVVEDTNFIQDFLSSVLLYRLYSNIVYCLLLATLQTLKERHLTLYTTEYFPRPTSS